MGSGFFQTRSPLAVAALTAVMLCFVSGCSLLKSGTRSSKISSFSGNDNTIPSFEYSLYSLDSLGNETSFLGTIQRVNGQFELPTAVLESLEIQSAPQYIIKAYSTTDTGKDEEYFYETPVLSASTLEFSGATTALWLAYKWSVQSGQTRFVLDRNMWEGALFELETRCAACTRKSAAEIFALIKLDPAFISFSIEPSALASPPIVIAKSSPPIIGLTSSLLGVDENTDVTLTAEFYRITASTSRLTPSQWSIEDNLGADQVLAPNQESLDHTFSNAYLGRWSIIASVMMSDGSLTKATFRYQVNAINHQPFITGNTLFTLRANHNSTIDLNTVVSDPDSDTLTYTLVSAPTGVSFVTAGGSSIQWNPLQSADGTNQVGAQTIQISASDNRGGAASTTISINVLPDLMPSFTSVPTGGALSLTEGQTASLAFTLTDSDGDPITLTCTNESCGTTPLPPGFAFEGAGWGVLPITYTGLPSGPQTATVSFRPSFSQANSVASVSRTLQLQACYDTVARPDLRNICTVPSSPLTTGTSPASTSITVSIANVDDAPSWQTQPATNLIPVENTAFNSILGTAIDAAIYNPTGITYSLTPGSASANCSWIQVKTTGLQSEVWDGGAVVPYNSAGTCTFQIRATDAAGLYTDSQVITYTITDVNRAPASVGAIPNQSCTENTLCTFSLGAYFSDLDLTVVDPREALVYDCTNCAAKNITSYSFNGSTFSWTPPYSFTTAAFGNKTETGLIIQVRDKAGVTQNHATTFDITVSNVEGPMVLSAGSASALLNEGAAGSIPITISNTAGDSSTYNYNITVTCVPTCSFATLSVATGSGASALNLNLAPNSTHGGTGASSGTTSQTYDLILTVRHATDPSIYVAKNFTIEVINTLP